MVPPADEGATALRRCGLAIVPLLLGCEPLPPPYVPRQTQDWKIAHCFDGVPHQPGTKPWILGGTCCCTPTDELMEAYHRDGFCVGMTTADLIALYHEKGIVLAYDHALCNNLCEEGPHVTQGGRCMAPPTPGTRQFERVATGQSQTAVSRPPKSAETKGGAP